MLILYLAVSAISALVFSTATAAETVFQKMKRAALEQACRGGDQKSCQDLARMGPKSQGRSTSDQSQQSPGPQQPGQQQPGQKAPKQEHAQQQASGQLNDSGPFKP